MNPKVLIGIGTFENFEYVEKHSIKKILDQTYKNFDVLIVDNSKDLKHMMNLRTQFPSVIVEHISRPRYLRDALREMRQFVSNYAISHGYDYLLFVDVDHLLEKNTLEKLISHKKDFVTAVIGYPHQDYSTCFIRDYKETRPSYVPAMPPLKALFYDVLEKETELIQILAAGLACALINVRVMMGINFYCTHRQAAMMEDMIFCADLNKKGIKLYCDPNVKPFHLHVKMAARNFRDKKI